MNMFDVAPVTESDAPALVAMMKREGSPCFCRFWHFGGTNKEWEARCALDAEKNERELVEAIVAGRDDGRGLVARPRVATGDADSRVVGWMKLTWRRSLSKLTARVPYRGLD